ncbi:centrosomal protein CEP57L1 [Chanos chanos]|uniref:Centrosomal protein 57kDa-like protein 1 n=1 Tax=Chanos chanos TaxID=29144 RepID=A0A6J2V365_CHACN|nr:centrosomal protein CEP57L1 [Chanos chanos]
MEQCQDQSFSLDSPFKQSYVGSFHLPPEKLSHRFEVKEPSLQLAKTQKYPQNINLPVRRTTHDAESRAVIAALKTLQEKMRRLELERVQAEKNVRRFSQEAQRCVSSSDQGQRSTGESDSSRKIELVTQLQSAEQRCVLLEKQLDYMKKMVEKTGRERLAQADRQEGVERAKPRAGPDIQTQLQKLERLERECLKLTSTQSEAERKIELLEQKLLEEEHERRLVQEKADELERELEFSLRSLSAATAEKKTKKKNNKDKMTGKKSSTVRSGVSTPRQFPKAKHFPFVAGTSTSPSHSVNANVQSVLHLMKHGQPQLCERMRSLSRSGSENRPGAREVPVSPRIKASTLGSLSELLLALQDELGQMSFEHQELVRQIDETEQRELREDLERELDCLVKKMEVKAAQISQLRKHQQVVHKLSRPSHSPRKKKHSASAEGRARGLGGVQDLTPSPVKSSPRGQSHPKTRQGHLQLLRESQRLRCSLRRDDITWES